MPTIARVLLTLALTALALPAAPTLHTLATRDGVNYSLAAIQPGGALTELFTVGVGFNGGLAYDPDAGMFYAISNDENAKSTLNSISWDGVVKPILTAGEGFFGGLALDGPGKLLAIGADSKYGIQSALYSLDAVALSSTHIADLGEGAISFHGGLSRNTALTLLGTNGASWSFYSYEPLTEIRRAEGAWHGAVPFPAAGGIAWDADKNVWRVVSIDFETGAPIITGYNNFNLVEQWQLDLMISGLTYAEKNGGGTAVPEPATSALLAVGLGLLLYLRRRS